MVQKIKHNITVFHCINSFDEKEKLPSLRDGTVAMNVVHLPCSSMVKDVYLLRALESGADAVIVLACPQGACRYVEGNIRASKRVGWVKALLDEIGLNGRRLSLYHMAAGDNSAADKAIQDTVALLEEIGTNPASRI